MNRIAWQSHLFSSNLSSIHGGSCVPRSFFSSIKSTYLRPIFPRYSHSPCPPFCLPPSSNHPFLQGPLDRFFHEYTGGTDVNKGAKYILWRFMQANRARLNVYPQFVNSLTLFPTRRLTSMRVQYYPGHRHV